MTTNPVGSPLQSKPQAFAGVKAAALAINKSGGIRGHEVKVITCNSQFDPNQEVACANKAVSVGAVAMVGSLVAVNPGSFENVLQNANIANLAPLGVSASQFSGDVAFPLVVPVAEGTICTTSGLAKVLGNKTNRVASVGVSIPAIRQIAIVVQNSANLQRGAKFLGAITVGLTTVDFSPVVAQAAALNPNVIVLSISASGDPAFITAAESAGHSWVYCSSDSAFPTKVLVALGSSSPRVFVGAPFPPLSAASKFPELKTFIAQMRAEQATGDAAASLVVSNYDSAALNAWLGMQVFAQVARSIHGQVTNSSFLAALKTAKVNLGLIPPIDFAKPVGSGTYPRVFSSKVYLEGWNPKKKELVLYPNVTVSNSFAVSGLG